MSSLSHDEFMDIICGVCARKGAYSRKRDGKRSAKHKLGKFNPITDDILGLIRTHHFPDYMIGSCPRVVCTSCLMALQDAEKNGDEAKRKLPDTDYSLFQVPRRTRASDCCTCRWCWVGKLKAQQYTNYCKSVMNKRGRPRTNPAPSTEDTPTVAKCQYCHTVRGHGVPHNCSKKDRNNNLAAMVRDVSPHSQERVVSQLISGICEEKNVKQSDNLVLVAGNNKEKIIHFGPQKPQPQWSVQEMIEFGNDKVSSLYFHYSFIFLDNFIFRIAPTER